jgi:hypothetical protein
MNRDALIMSLYRSSEALNRAYLALDLAGHTDSAKLTREAATNVMHAIAKLVGERAGEQVTS